MYGVIDMWSAIFSPLDLSAGITESDFFIVQINSFGIQNGEPYIDSKGYENITEEQKGKIVGLVQEYSYKRTLNTYISDGAIEKIGNKTASIYIYDNEGEAKSIYVSDSGQISINDRLYEMKNAKQFNERLEDILKE